MPDETTVVIPEEPKEEVVSIEEQVADLSEEERQMAEEHGLIKKTEEKKPDEKEPAPKKEPEEPEKMALKEEDYDDFDKVHELYENNKEAFYALPRAVKNLYHNGKGLYKRAKDEEEKRKKLEDDGGYNKLQESVARVKIERLGKRLAEAKVDPENKGLTVEELEELVDLQKKESDDDRPLTKKDLEDLRKKESDEFKKKQDEETERKVRVAGKIQETEIFAKDKISDLTDGKYDKFDDVVTLAHEVAQSKPRFARQIAEVLNGDDPIEDVVDTVISIAKINPKYGSKVSEKVDIERMEKNAQKAKTSASITAGKGGRVVSHDDLTPEDAAKLSKDQWEKLPRDVRRRLLMQI